MDVPRILIVEDDPVMSMHLEALVAETIVSEVFTAASVAEATIALDRRPDYALLDVEVADGTTYDLAIRLSAAGIPFVFVSASDRQALPAALRSVTFVTKPYDDGEIVALLEAFVRRRG